MKNLVTMLLALTILLSLAACSTEGKPANAETQAHTHSYREDVTPATCTEKGYTTYTCECGDSYIGAETAAIGHSYSEWEITKAATCTESGTKERICSCGNKQEQKIAATGHSYSEWETTKAATCTESGTKERICSCGDKQEQKISPTGHSYGAWKTAKAATCTESGTKERICSCGDKQTEKINSTGHSYGAWKTTKNATCTQKGMQERTCSCGAKDTKEIQAKGHSYSAATCTAPKTCTACGTTSGDALGHTTDDGTCDRCGEEIANDQSLVVDGAYSALKSWLVPYLKNPSSLIINSVTYSKYESNTTPGEYLYVMFINYSAMNGFGGYNRESVMYYCDSQKIYKSKDTSNYTIIDVGSLSSDNIALLNSVF